MCFRVPDCRRWDVSKFPLALFNECTGEMPLFLAKRRQQNTAGHLSVLKTNRKIAVFEER